jgi:NAD(P)-dependent dehydrogenase (short-subunit alcohol dehydrogenase family)
MKRIWMITGASRGLGAQIGQTVLVHGDSVVATARRASSAATMPNTLCAYGDTRPNGLDERTGDLATIKVSDGRYWRLYRFSFTIWSHL